MLLRPECQEKRDGRGMCRHEGCCRRCLMLGWRGWKTTEVKKQNLWAFRGGKEEEAVLFACFPFLRGRCSGCLYAEEKMI